MNENDPAATEPESSSSPTDPVGRSSIGSPRTGPIPIEEMFDRLIQAMPWPKPEFLQEIAVREDEALPILRDRLDRITRRLMDQDDLADYEYNEVFFYCGLLDMIHVPEIVDSLVTVVRRLAPKHSVELYDFFNTLFLSMERFGGDVAEPLMDIARDEWVHPDVRSNAMFYAFRSVSDDPVLQTRVITECMNLLEPVLALGTMVGLDRKMVSYYCDLTSCLAFTASPLAREMLNTLVKMGGFDSSYLKPEDLERYYREKPSYEIEYPIRRDATWLTDYRVQYRDYDRPFRRHSVWSPLLSAMVERQNRQDRYELVNVPIADALGASPAKEPSASPRPAVFPPPLATAAPSPSHSPLMMKPLRNTAPPRGRNDKCWCGSGKKYKNCHLRADQSEEAGSNSDVRPEAETEATTNSNANSNSNTNDAITPAAQEHDA